MSKSDKQFHEKHQGVAYKIVVLFWIDSLFNTYLSCITNGKLLWIQDQTDLEGPITITFEPKVQITQNKILLKDIVNIYHFCAGFVRKQLQKLLRFYWHTLYFTLWWS